MAEPDPSNLVWCDLNMFNLMSGGNKKITQLYFKITVIVKFFYPAKINPSGAVILPAKLLLHLNLIVLHF